MGAARAAGCRSAQQPDGNRSLLLFTPMPQPDTEGPLVFQPPQPITEPPVDFQPPQLRLTSDFSALARVLLETQPPQEADGGAFGTGPQLLTLGRWVVVPGGFGAVFFMEVMASLDDCEGPVTVGDRWAPGKTGPSAKPSLRTEGVEHAGLAQSVRDASHEMGRRILAR